ncbi:MAG: minor capsid protein [bacterium]|nr:minor capsid protein [bacterium]
MPKYENEIYDIQKAFASVEDELIKSMIRNLKHHRAWEDDEGFLWEQWQVKQLHALDVYRRENTKKFGDQFIDINNKIDTLIEIARKEGNTSQEVALLKAIKNGHKAEKIARGTYAEFFNLNTRELDALVNATKKDFKKAEIAMLRQANDQYRKIIFNAQVYANTGAGTYEKAVDMATKDFLSKGINCIEYSNGARHTMKDYSEMCLKTATKRAYLTGEGEKRMEWGEHLVIMNKRGNPCPLCKPFVGKIMIDDVWSAGSSKDGHYMLMSSAIEAGLYHPRCKDSHTTYFEGITTVDEVTKKESQEMVDRYNEQAKQQYRKRQVEKYNRLSEYSLDEDNKKQYKGKEKVWAKQLNAIENSGSSDIINALPNTDRINIPEAKFTQYALNPEKDKNKARAFKEALGYDLSNANDLIQNIKNNITKFEAVKKDNTGYGDRYQVVMELTGPNGKKASVLTAWIDDKQKNEMRLTTAHIDKKVKK